MSTVAPRVPGFGPQCQTGHTFNGLGVVYYRVSIGKVASRYRSNAAPSHRTLEAVPRRPEKTVLDVQVVHVGA